MNDGAVGGSVLSTPHGTFAQSAEGSSATAPLTPERTGLTLRRFGVAFGPEVVLSNVCLEVPPVGVTVLVGPTASGKSTLMRTLAGFTARHPALRTWGSATLGERALVDASPPPALVVQDAQFLVSRVRENLLSAIPHRSKRMQFEQLALLASVLVDLGQDDLLAHLDAAASELPVAERRRVAIVRAALSNASVLLVDEPTANLPEEEAHQVLDLLGALAESRAVVVSTHRQTDLRHLGGRVALLAGGRVVETGEVAEFLAAPTTEAGRSWVATGNCRLPSPSARAEDLAEGVAAPTPLPPATRRRVASALEPRGFFWLVPGKLAGMPRPGVVSELEQDLTGLQELGVDLVLNLEESAMVPVDRLAAHGILCEPFPIPDMAAPSPEAALQLCRRIDEALARGRVVAVHCLAGLGRTGTVLAAYAISRGDTAVAAIEAVRSLRPRAIQSEAQTEFLEAFEAYVAQLEPSSEARRRN